MAKVLFYNPDTGEGFLTDRKADWMGVAPAWSQDFNKQTQAAFFENGNWVIKNLDDNSEEKLKELKELKMREIDAKTDELINKQGLSYDSNVFSMSTKAQSNWTDLALGVIAGLIQFPYKIQKKDESEYILESKEKAMQFIMAVAAFKSGVNSPLGTGRDLKEKVSKAVSIKELDLIIDTRN